MKYNLVYLPIIALVQSILPSVQAGSLSYTNTAVIVSEHSITAAIGIGASSSFSDAAVVSLPLFNTNIGALQSVSIQLGTQRSSFVGTISGLPGLSVSYSQIQQMSWTLTNIHTSYSGALVGPSNQLVHLDLGTSTISTNTAIIAASALYTNQSDLATFATGSGGSFYMNGDIQSDYSLGLVNVLCSMNGVGTNVVQAILTYNYVPILSVVGPHNPGSSSNCLLSYSTNIAANYILETASDLTSPTWAVVTNTAAVSNAECVVTVPATSAIQFFRLRQKQ